MFMTFAMFCLAASCESLASFKLPDTTITWANTVAAGAFRLPIPGGSAAASQFSTLPVFCGVACVRASRPVCGRMAALGPLSARRTEHTFSIVLQGRDSHCLQMMAAAECHALL